MRIRTYVTILILFFIEFTVFNHLRILDAKPELLVITTIFFGFYFGAGQGLVVGALSGALKDIFSITGFGVNTFSFLLIGALSGVLRDKLFKEGFLTQFLFSSVSVYAISGVYFLYIAGILKCDTVGQGFWETSVIKGLYTGCAAPFLFFILGKLFIRET